MNPLPPTLEQKWVRQGPKQQGPRNERPPQKEKEKQEIAGMPPGFGIIRARSFCGSSVQTRWGQELALSLCFFGTLIPHPLVPQWGFGPRLDHRHQ